MHSVLDGIFDVFHCFRFNCCIASSDDAKAAELVFGCGEDMDDTVKVISITRDWGWVTGCAFFHIAFVSGLSIHAKLP